MLPGRFPNLLVNGSQGIAVGMATNIPPHNLGEVIDATIHLIDHPDATPDDLMQFVKGPDFPTGGLILGRAGIMEAYRTGRGSVKMRAKAEIEEAGKRGDRFQIVVTEMPYQVSHDAVANRIKELADSGELGGIDDVNDETSQKTGTRFVVTLKRDANANVVLNNLFKLTQLQTSFPVNMVALVDGVPRTLNLVQALTAYVEHQVEVITRRTEFRLDKARRRAHIVEGLLKAINVIDEVIALIRASDDRAGARDRAHGRAVRVQRGAGRAHPRHAARSAHPPVAHRPPDARSTQLRETIAELEAILADEGRKRAVIKDELNDVKATFATPRRASITHDTGDMSVEDLVDDKELVVVMTQAGYVKTIDADTFRTAGPRRPRRGRHAPARPGPRVAR